jgi:hypothetical protein
MTIHSNIRKFSESYLPTDIWLENGQVCIWTHIYISIRLKAMFMDVQNGMHLKSLEG